MNKVFWLSVMAAMFLLLCSVVYTDFSSGKEYLFVSLFYDETVINALNGGALSIDNILLGYDTSYLWMFCPIIVGIPCVILKKTERFILFRTNKNRYFLSKYLINLVASGMIMLIAYLVYMIITMVLIKDNIWNMNLVKKLLSVFVWGLTSAIPSIILSEFVNNKYLILCVPFVINYFMYTFLGRLVSYEISQYISPSTYQILFLYDNKMVITCMIIMIIVLSLCAVVKKVIMERRCDCGI